MSNSGAFGVLSRLWSHLSKALTIIEVTICTDCRFAGVSNAQFRLCLTHRAITNYEHIQVSSFIPPKIAIPLG